jgi:hypothetical protein
VAAMKGQYDCFTINTRTGDVKRPLFYKRSKPWKGEYVVSSW